MPADMPHSRVVAQLALVASYIIVLHFAVDVLAGGFPDSTPIRALKQALTD